MHPEPLPDRDPPPSSTASEQARRDLPAALSAQVGDVAARAARRPGRAGDVRWWAAALDGPARTVDDALARRGGPSRCRRPAPAPLRHRGSDETRITHGASPSCGAALVAAAAGVLADPARERGWWIGPAVAGAAVPVLSVLLGLGRLVPAAGPGALLAGAGLVLLGGALVAARVRAVRAARDRALARRVRDAVLAAAGRELRRVPGRRPAWGPVRSPGGTAEPARAC